jgi:hypothetical protein
VQQTYVATNANDGNQNTYWESANNAFPQTLTVDLCGSASVNQVVLKLPSAWGTRNQTVAVSTSTDNANYSTAANAASYAFNPTGNTVTITFAARTARYVRLTVPANTGWPAGQLSEFEVRSSGTPPTTPPPTTPPPTTPPPTTPPPTVNLALGKAISAQSVADVYVATRANDGDANSYWESANNAFPQWIQVDLGTSMTVGRLTLKLPPATAWGTRTQTIAVQVSTNGTSWSTLVAATGRTFNPATGNTVTFSVPSTNTRYVRLVFSANTGWPAGQLSEFEIRSA